MKYASIFKMPNISFRFFNVYGPKINISGPYSAVIGNFLFQKKNNKPLTIVGNGQQTRDFIHIDDLVSAFLKAIKSKRVNKIYNLGSGKRTSINTIAKIIGGKKKFIHLDQGDQALSCKYLEIKKRNQLEAQNFNKHWN